jgi:hypothetical protein
VRSACSAREVSSTRTAQSTHREEVRLREMEADDVRDGVLDEDGDELGVARRWKQCRRGSERVRGGMGGGHNTINKDQGRLKVTHTCTPQQRDRLVGHGTRAVVHAVAESLKRINTKTRTWSTDSSVEPPPSTLHTRHVSSATLIATSTPFSTLPKKLQK